MSDATNRFDVPATCPQCELRFQNELTLCKQIAKLKQRISELEEKVRMLGDAHHDEIETRTENTELRAKLEQIKILCDVHAFDWPTPDGNPPQGFITDNVSDFADRILWIIKEQEDE